MGAQIAFVRRNRIHLTRKFRTLLPARVAQQKRPAYAKEYAALESYLSEVQPVASSGQTPIPKKAFAQAVAAYLDSAVSDLKNKK